MSDQTVPPRMIEPSPEEEFFWKSGADGNLRFMTCKSCNRFHHPPLPHCPYCQHRELEPRAVSGRATVATFTINYQPFIPGFDPPYAIAIVEIEEDPTVRLTTNIIDCDLDSIEIGMDVHVVFEENGEWYVPLFTPDSGN